MGNRELVSTFGRRGQLSPELELVPLLFPDSADEAERIKIALTGAGIEAVIDFESAKPGVVLENPIVLVAEKDFEAAEQIVAAREPLVGGDWDEDDDALDDDDDDDDDDFLPDDEEDDYDDDDEEGEESFDDE